MGHGYLPAPPSRPAPSEVPPTDAVVWCLALAPLIVGLLTYGSPGLWWLVVVVNLALCFWDEKLLKESGCGEVGGSFFLIPVYLFQRAKLLNDDPHYAWVWIATFCVNVVFLSV